MDIVTLITDLGYRDPYLGIVKAKLISSQIPMHIIDLSCDIKANNISDAAFILKNSLDHFPPGTIHLVAINFIVNRSTDTPVNIDNSRYLITSYKEQIIVTPDTGLFTLIDARFNEPVYQIYYEGGNKHHFFLKDVFADVALQLLKKIPLTEIATPVTDYYKAVQFESFLNGNILRGKGIYVDGFGNIVTNITRAQFSELVGKRSFVITLPGIRLNKIQTTYEDVKFGSPLVLFNSFGHLEVAINGSSAHKMLCRRDIGPNLDFTLMIEIL